MSRIKVDERLYDKADVTIAMLGDIPAGVTELEYSAEMEHNKVYGLGSRSPIAYGMGQEDFSASMTLLMTEVIRIEDKIKDKINGSKKLAMIKPFWIVVTYTNEYYKVVVDKLLVKFQDQGRSVNTEAGLARQFNLFVLDIQFNVL